MDTLIRYTPQGTEGDMRVDPNGDYVKWADVQRLLARKEERAWLQKAASRAPSDRS